MTTKRIAEFGISKSGKTRRKLREKPCDDSVSDRCAINIAPLQLGQKLRRIHSVRLERSARYTINSTWMRDLKSLCLREQRP
jgi:hypothetical protein